MNKHASYSDVRCTCYEANWFFHSAAPICLKLTEVSAGSKGNIDQNDNAWGIKHNKPGGNPKHGSNTDGNHYGANVNEHSNYGSSGDFEAYVDPIVLVLQWTLTSFTKISTISFFLQVPLSA